MNIRSMSSLQNENYDLQREVEALRRDLKKARDNYAKYRKANGDTAPPVAVTRGDKARAYILRHCANKTNGKECKAIAAMFHLSPETVRSLWTKINNEILTVNSK